MTTNTNKQTTDLLKIQDAIDLDNKTEVSVISDVSSIIWSLQLAIATTKVDDLYSGGDVMTASIVKESEPGMISRELSLRKITTTAGYWHYGTG